MTRGKSTGPPDRWLNYSNHGKVLIDKFIALKVPLSRRTRGVPYNSTFCPEYVVQKLRLGLIIDLTNTSRYYNPSEFTLNGVEHVKINVPGKRIPPWRIVQRFIAVVKGYLDGPNYDGKLIGVHCTHGLNRTGYMVCAYMILELGYSPRDAIKLFNQKRGHEMEHDYYLKSLQEMGSGRCSDDGRHRSPLPEHDEHQSRWQDGASARHDATDERSNWRDGPRTGQDSYERSNWRDGPRIGQDSYERSNWRERPSSGSGSHERSNWRDGPRTGQDSYDRSNWRDAPGSGHDSQQDRQRPYQWRPWNGGGETEQNGQERWDPSVRRIVRSRQSNYRVPAYRRTGGEEQRQHIKFD